MIDLQHIATQFNKMVGANDFIIYLDTNLTPIENDTDRTLCVLMVSRNPQALGNAIDSETLTLTFTFDFNITKREQAEKRKTALARILGWQSFQIHTPEGDTYDVDSWLDLMPPEPARVDEGQLKQILSVNGTALVANHSVGAVVSNRIRTYINGDEVTVMNYSAALAKGTDELVNLSGDNYQIEPQEISRTNTADITVLYTGSTIDKYFRNLIENGEVGSDEQMNEIYSVVRAYPDAVITKEMKLLEASVIGQAGAYFYYRLTLRKVNSGALDVGTTVKSIVVDGTAELAPGEIGTYTATVSYYGADDDAEVTWGTSDLPPFCSIQRNNDGSICIANNSPLSGISEAQITRTVTAVSIADGSFTYSIPITFTYFRRVTSVEVLAIPSTGFDGDWVPFGKRARVKAIVYYNDGSSDSNVTFSIALSGGAGITVDGNGYVSNESYGNDGNDIEVTVTATSNFDNSKTASLTLTCECGADWYGISYENNAHASVDGPSSAREGDEVTVYGEADENYTITKISVWLGEERLYQVEDGNELTFIMPGGDVTITVNYADY